MSRAIVHIGTHKTGTTTLQKWLDAASDRLQSAGIVYPRAGRPDSVHEDQYGHHRLVYGLLKKYGVEGEEDWARVKHEAESQQAETVVISSENFTNLDQQQVRRVREQLADYQVQIVLYLRNPVGFLKSAWKQGIKTGKCRSSFEHWVAAGSVSRALYADIVDRWEQVFGREHVTVVLYDKCRAEDGIEGPLFDLLNTPVDMMQEFRQPRVNTSPTDRQIAALQLINTARRKFGMDWPLAVIRRVVLRSVGVGRVLGIAAEGFVPTGADDQHLEEFLETINENNRRLVGRYIDESDWRYIAC